MSVNAEVQKSGNETALATIRKFSRRVQSTGLVKSSRTRRYYARATSKIVKKKRALKLIKRRAEYKRLVKEGKIAEAPTRNFRPAPMRDASQGGKLGQDTPIAR